MKHSDLSSPCIRVSYSALSIGEAVVYDDVHEAAMCVVNGRVEKGEDEYTFVAGRGKICCGIYYGDT